MHIENILIEHWPRLQSANFYLLFTDNLVQVSSVRVHLRPTSIIVKFEDTNKIIIALDSIGLQIQVNSLSLLMAKKNLISFRANTDVDDSFHRELLDVPALPTIQNTLVKLPINIVPNEEFTIKCKNCHCQLSASLSFERVLELPSENMDLSEWYCHKPMNKSETGEENSDNDDSIDHCEHSAASDDHSNANAKHNYVKFIPRRDDLLYGNFFVLFHTDQFTGLTIDSGAKLIHCRRCLRHIGECLRSKTIRVWNCNVNVDRKNRELSPHPLFDGTTCFGNFMFILNKIIIDFDMVVAVAQQSQRIIFEAVGIDGRQQFLLLHIMSKKQDIYQMDHMDLDDVIRLKSADVIKVLYRSESNVHQALLRFWQNDVNVINSQLSMEMFDAVLEKLNNWTKFVPDHFRENNGFLLSYIFKNEL